MKEQVLIVTRNEERSRYYRQMLSERPGEASIIRAESIDEAKSIVLRSFVDVLLLEPSELKAGLPQPACRAVSFAGDVRQSIAYVRAYVFRHYAERLTARELAALVSVTPNYLLRMFRLMEGIGFREFLENTRLERAAALLRGTDRQVREIARAVGYPDGSYFGRRFRTVFGYTPTEYRKVCGKRST